MSVGLCPDGFYRGCDIYGCEGTVKYRLGEQDTFRCPHRPIPVTPPEHAPGSPEPEG